MFPPKLTKEKNTGFAKQTPYFITLHYQFPWQWLLSN